LPYDLVGIGNPVYDIIVTPETRTDGRVLSGCSTNACLSARRLGLKRVGLMGSIGPDFAERFKSDMTRYDIGFKLASRSKETGGFSLVYDDHGDRTLDVLGVAGKITAEDVPPEFLDTRFVIIGPILGEIDLDLIRFLRSSSRAKLFLDPQGLIRVIGKDGRISHKCDREQFAEVAKLVDFIKPNEHESETITGEKDPQAAVRQIGKMGDLVPIVTLAERGSIMISGKCLYRIPPFRTHAIDPTGAGDVYAGSFVTEYARTGNLIEAALFASASASIMVEQTGPDFKMTNEEAQHRKETLRARLMTETLVP
jgi:sugar/nucleoside kinase (ribokinase family)